MLGLRCWEVAGYITGPSEETAGQEFKAWESPAQPWRGPQEAAGGGTAGPRTDGTLGRTRTTRKHKERGKGGLHKTPEPPKPERKEESQESRGDRGQRRRGSRRGVGTGSHVAGRELKGEA